MSPHLAMHHHLDHNVNAVEVSKKKRAVNESDFFSTLLLMKKVIDQSFIV